MWTVRCPCAGAPGRAIALAGALTRSCRSAQLVERHCGACWGCAATWPFRAPYSLGSRLGAVLAEAASPHHSAPDPMTRPTPSAPALATLPPATQPRYDLAAPPATSHGDELGPAGRLSPRRPFLLRA
uniref:Uncharacterized protein n=1 Tax=Heliothis virescens TaxID=7102 RepID=A0A2A4J396_HELVI